MGAERPARGRARAHARLLPRARRRVLGLNVPFLDLSRQTDGLRTSLEEAVARVLDSGRFVGGPEVEQFEQEFAAYCGTAHAVGVASGTDAIALALGAAGVSAGDEVLVPANTCVPTIAAIEQAGATPVLVDADADTATLDPERVRERIGPATRAIVPVHLYGRCADMEAIRAIADEHGLLVVEDAAQAHGARLGGRAVGTVGDAAAFSFYPTKNLGALGDAGAIVTNDDAIAERARLLRSYGERTRYESVLSGRNSRLDPVQAAILRVKLPLLDGWNERRRALAERYRAELADVPVRPLAPAADRASDVHHLFVVCADDRDGFRRSLESRGVDTLVHYPRAIHDHPAYRALRRAGSLSASEQLAREVTSLPLYPELTDAEVEAVVAAVRAARPEG